MFLLNVLVGNFGTGWHTAEGDISSAYRSFSNEKIFGRMGIYIGLSQVTSNLIHLGHSRSSLFAGIFARATTIWVFREGQKP